MKRNFAAGATLALVGLMGGTVAANAAPASVDPDATGSINIHKFEQPAVAGEAADGNIKDTTGLTPLEGVTFGIQRLDCVDLGTNSGWETAAEMVTSLKDAADKFAWAPSGCDLVDERSDETNASGDVVFGDLAVGQYLVTESYDGDLGVQIAPPFLVTVPLANTDGSWNYNVHVYPKNTVSSIEKTGDDADIAQVGDEINFTITTGIPAGTITKYVVTDDLPAGLDYDAITSVKAGSTVFTAGTDYEVSYDAGAHTATVTFTTEGLTALMAARDGGATKVETGIKTILNENGIDGVTNEASYTINNGNGDHTVDTGDGGKVVVKMGDKSFLKTNEDETENLADATFEVYMTHTAEWDKAAAVLMDKVGTNGVVVSDADGKFDVSGLRYTAWANNGNLTCDGDTPSADCNFYWLVETAAPEGYQSLAAPVQFQIDDSGSVQVVHNVATSSITGTLPLTGMNGIIFMVLVGALILGGAGYGMYRVSRTKA